MSEPASDGFRQFLWVVLSLGLLCWFLSSAADSPTDDVLGGTGTCFILGAIILAVVKRLAGAGEGGSSGNSSSAKMAVVCRRLCDELFGLPPYVTPRSTPDRPYVVKTDQGALLTGARQGIFIQIHAEDDPSYGEELRVAISPDCPHFWPDSRYGVNDITRATPGSHPVSVGDDVFHRRVKVYGPPQHSLAVMTSAVRKAALDGASAFWAGVELWTALRSSPAASMSAAPRESSPEESSRATGVSSQEQPGKTAKQASSGRGLEHRNPGWTWRSLP